MRLLILALACMWTLPAAAQDTPSVESVRALNALAAIWRPITVAPAQAAVEGACAGALEEIDAVEAALPPVLTPESVARVRSLHGLLILPSGDDPQIAYFFPSADMDWFASGLGAIAVLNETEGFIGVRDAAGRDIPFQLGRAGGRPMLRIRPPQGGILTFVGCASTS